MYIKRLKALKKKNKILLLNLICKSPIQFFAALIAAYPERNIERALTNFLMDIVSHRRTGKGNWAVVR